MIASVHGLQRRQDRDIEGSGPGGCRAVRRNGDYASIPRRRRSPIAVLTVGDDLRRDLGDIPRLIGKEPEAEEFDVE